MLGTLCLGYGRRAYADCAPSGSAGTYACSGSTTTTQSLSPAPASAPLVVTTTPGFGISTTTGDALDLSATVAGAGLSFTDAYASTIAGAGHGINATNLGSGDLTITTTGSVSGGVLQSTSASGILAKNYGGALTITAAGVAGTDYGISTLNKGSGALSITTTGAGSPSLIGAAPTRFRLPTTPPRSSPISKPISLILPAATCSMRLATDRLAHRR